MWPRILVVLVLAIAARDLYPQGVVDFRRSQPYLHRKLKSRETTIRSVTLLPPTIIRANFRLIAFLEAEEEESEEARSDIAGIVSDALRKRGWEVNVGAFSSQALQGNERLRNLVDYVRARHLNLLRQMINRPKDVSKGRYSLGEEVASLNAAAPADALVLVRSHSFSRWDQKQMSMSILLVDPHSGEVLCFSRAVGGRMRGKLDYEGQVDSETA